MTDYPFYPGDGNASPGYQTATIANVPADGIATSPATVVVFPSGYANEVAVRLTVVVTASSGPAGTYPLSAQLAGVPTLTGFTFTVTGGPIGSTCSVIWEASGT